MNFLEELVAEWYEYKGYFVCRNVPVGRDELDVVAFHPQTKDLVHIEPTMYGSWKELEDSYKKKFKAGRDYISSIFSGLLPNGAVPRQIVLHEASKKRTEFAGGEAIHVAEFLKPIVKELSDRSITKTVPEKFPLLRTLWYAAYYQKELFEQQAKPSGN